MNVKIELAGAVTRVTVGNEEHTITASVADGCTHGPDPVLARQREADLEESLGSMRATIGRRDATIAALERQIDTDRDTHAAALDQSAKHLAIVRGDLVSATLSANEHLATIKRMQPLCDAAQRAARAWGDQSGESINKPLSSPAIAAFSDLWVAEGAYETACADAANDADIPF